MIHVLSIFTTCIAGSTQWTAISLSAAWCSWYRLPQTPHFLLFLQSFFPGFLGSRPAHPQLSNNVFLDPTSIIQYNSYPSRNVVNAIIYLKSFLSQKNYQKIGSVLEITRQKNNNLGKEASAKIEPKVPGQQKDLLKTNLFPHIMTMRMQYARSTRPIWAWDRWHQDHKVDLKDTLSETVSIRSGGEGIKKGRFLVFKYVKSSNYAWELLGYHRSAAFHAVWPNQCG